METKQASQKQIKWRGRDSGGRDGEGGGGEREREIYWHSCMHAYNYLDTHAFVWQLSLK